MISYTTRPAGYGPPILDCTGLASDDKDGFAQTNSVPNGSTFYEIDGDHRVFMWNAESGTWVEQ